MPQYEQKVSVDDLRLGMYVSRLDRPWIETHFLFQGFHVSSEADMQELRRTCEYVFVDPERGEAPETEARRLAPVRSKPVGEEVFRNAPDKGVYPVVTSMDEELQAARDSRAMTLAEVSNILDELKAGRKIQIESVRQAVTGMIASIVRNPDAFLWLTRLKDKDSYAFAHCVDASSLAVAFGRHLGFAQPELEDLAIGTLLFDIGKLQLPDDILKKPGRLTEKEFALIRRHVEFGVQIVEEMKGSSKNIVSTVRYHHERHDGKGYPRGVAGKRIPVFGRIAALVDCYDAITSERPYSHAMSAYDAVQLIYEWRDKDFQADMVEQFIQCIGVFPAGTLVELSTGEVGIVIAQNRVRRLKPRIMLVLDSSKVALEFNPILDLIENPLDSEGRPVEIRQPLVPGSYGIQASDFYL
jgi:HD-GYP domain-containing protein (c-di-GMP phosphodiesterase class II)